VAPELRKTDHAVIHIGSPAAKETKQPGDDSAPPRIIMRLTTRRVRDAMYAARRQLKLSSPNTGSAVYINEDLTKESAALFKEARQLVKNKTVFGCWTTNDIVHVKRSSDGNCKPLKILSVSDLQQLRRN